MMSMMTALVLFRDEMQGEICSECRDLRKNFNAADRPQKHSPQGSIQNTPAGVAPLVV